MDKLRERERERNLKEKERERIFTLTRITHNKQSTELSESPWEWKFVSLSITFSPSHNKKKDFWRLMKNWYARSCWCWCLFESQLSAKKPGLSPIFLFQFFLERQREREKRGEKEKRVKVSWEKYFQISLRRRAASQSLRCLPLSKFFLSSPSSFFPPHPFLPVFLPPPSSCSVFILTCLVSSNEI